jgi:hypothetical protein
VGAERDTVSLKKGFFLPIGIGERIGQYFHRERCCFVGIEVDYLATSPSGPVVQSPFTDNFHHDIRVLLLPALPNIFSKVPNQFCSTSEDSPINKTRRPNIQIESMISQPKPGRLMDTERAAKKAQIDDRKVIDLSVLYIESRMAGVPMRSSSAAPAAWTVDE